MEIPFPSLQRPRHTYIFSQTSGGCSIVWSLWLGSGGGVVNLRIGSKMDEVTGRHGIEREAWKGLEVVSVRRRLQWVLSIL